LASEGVIKNSRPVVDAIFQRESLLSSYTTPDWAIPHVRGSYSRLAFAFAHCPAGIQWFCGRRVRTIFLCVVPETDAMLYLGLLSAFARLSQSHEQLSALLSATTPEMAFSAFGKIAFHTGHPGPS